MEGDDDYQAAGGGRKKGYDDDVNNFSCNGSSTIQDGIVRDDQRSCTDCCFLLVFLAFVGSMGFLTYKGFHEGDVKKLLAPLDGDHKFCGIRLVNNETGEEEYDYSEYGKLYITDFETVNVNSIFGSAVCVKECPATVDDEVDCKLIEGKEDCTAKPEKYATKDIVNICMPTDPPESIKEGFKMLKQIIQNQPGFSYINDLYLSSTSCYISIGMSVFYCLVFIYLMSAFAEPIAWFCVLLLQLFLLGCAGALWFARVAAIEDHAEQIATGVITLGDDKDKKLTDQETGILVACCIMGVLALGFFCCVCCGYTSLKLAIDVIDASADFLAGTKRILIVPGIFFLLQILVVVVWVCCMVCVAAMNEINVDTTIPQGKDLVWTEKTTYMGLYMLFGVLWICAWFEYASTFIVMVSAATYYFNSDADHEGSAEVGTGFSWAFYYHAGSIAIGAFIIALIRFIRIVFVYLAQQAEQASGDNEAVKMMVRCAECILACIEKICDYINESAYAYMAVSGENFCVSAWNGFLLNIKHMLKFSFANIIAKVFILLGKVAITAANIFSLIEIMKYRKDTEEVSSLAGPVVLVGVVSFMTASIFLGLFDTAVMALMTCLAIDMDLNNGEPKFGPPTFHDHVQKVDAHNHKGEEEHEGGSVLYSRRRQVVDQLL